MATLTDLLANLDPSPQVRGRQFERICQWYLRHHPQYEAQLEDVWLWDEWPERDGRDLGVVGLAADRVGTAVSPSPLLLHRMSDILV